MLAWLNQADHGEEQAVQETLQRVQEAVLPEDQLAALQRLAGLLASPPASQAFCSLGGFASLEVLLEGSPEDVEMTRAVLECCAGCLGLESASQDAAGADAAAASAVQLARTPGLVPRVLTQLDPQQPDFYCRCVACRSATCA